MNPSTTKRAIIMGATSGIGYEVAKLLIAEGWYLGKSYRPFSGKPLKRFRSVPLIFERKEPKKSLMR